MTVTAEDKEGAKRLLPVLAAWEAELVSQDKKRSTVHTHIDRCERFLRRVIDG